MDADRIKAEMDLFTELLQQPEGQREAFIDDRCPDDPALAGRLRNLLQGHERAEAAVATREFAEQTAVQMPSEIDSFRVIRKLGEGGMGVVYVAEQTRPVRRQVAIKLVKSGVDSKEVIARFHAERQALALMNHKNIAQILDAGVFEGRPYFVMELIAGIPITEYCDKRALPVVDRLRLFTEVCQGVQHAHQKGVIHRDIKPSNVLVAEEDGVPYPKIIDFGIAKAVTNRLLEATIHTEMGQIIGTPDYMCPEQADISALDIDTRADVYSLGAMLYELLSGCTVFGLAEKRAGLDEIRNTIMMRDPIRPSARMKDGGRLVRERARCRSSEPGSLARILQQDLDWITLRALERDRVRRYASASELAADVTRFLRQEPVVARPPTTSYRVRKFVRRHKGMITAAVVVFVSLLAGAVVSTNQYFHAESERVRADQLRLEATERAVELEQVAKFQGEQLMGIDVPLMADRLRRGVTEKARAFAEGADEIEADLFMVQMEKLLDGADLTGLTLNILDEYIFKRTLDTISEQFDDQPLVRARLQEAMAETVRELGLLDRAIAPQESSLAIRREALGDDHPDTLESINNMGRLLWAQGKLNDAEPFCHEAVEGRRQALGNDHKDTISSIINLGTLLRRMNKLGEAEAYLREALAGCRRVFGDVDPYTLAAIANLGVVLQSRGKVSEALPYYREALEGRRRVHGNEDQRTLVSMNNMGHILRSQGKLDEAMPYYDEALKGFRRALGNDHSDTLVTILNMGGILKKQGKLDEAEPYYREALEGFRRTLSDEHPYTLAAINGMGSLLRDQGKLNEAELYYREALEARRHVLGSEHARTLQSIDHLGALLNELGRYDDATEILQAGEAAARRVHVGGNTRLLGNYLAKLGVSRKGQGAFAEAESTLLEAYPLLVVGFGEEHDATKRTVERIIALYESWHAAEPGVGYDSRAAEWRARLSKEESDGDQSQAPSASLERAGRK
jgi:serine/threonine protein kinase/tetratricopeptide (TPR) repeat protein